jgi:hypothetical protein
VRNLSAFISRRFSRSTASDGHLLNFELLGKAGVRSSAGAFTKPESGFSIPVGPFEGSLDRNTFALKAFTKPDRQNRHADPLKRPPPDHNPQYSGSIRNKDRHFTHPDLLKTC